MSPTVGQFSRRGTGERRASTRTLLDALAEQLAAAAAALGPLELVIDDHALDEVARRLHGVESLLDELAAHADITGSAARHLHSSRDVVSVHLSAAASLRLLDLDANAGMVMRRAVESVRSPMAAFENPACTTPVYDAD